MRPRRPQSHLAPGRVFTLEVQLSPWRAFIPLLFALWLLFPLQGAAWAQTASIWTPDTEHLVLEPEWLDEQEPGMTWQQAQQTPGWFRPSGSVRSPTQGDLWIRARVESQTRQEVLLSLSECGAEEVELVVRHGEQVHTHLVDRDTPLAEREVVHRQPTVPLVLQPGTTQVFVRVSTEEFADTKLELSKPEHFWTTELSYRGWSALYFGLIVGLAVYNLFLYLFLRDRKYLLYVVMVGSAHLGLQLYIGGLAYELASWASPRNVATVGRSFSAFAGLFGTWFALEFLQARTKAPRFTYGLWATLAVSILGVVCAFLCPPAWCERIGLVIIVLAPTSIIGAGVEAHLRGHDSARYFLLAWAALCGAALITAAQVIGLLPITGTLGTPLLVGSAAEACLLSVALAHRISTLEREKDAAELAAERKNAALLEARLSASHARTEFLMLMSHELRTPLNHVLGGVQLLRCSDLSTEDQEYADIIESGGQSLLTLLDDMLLLVSHRDNEATVSWTPVDLVELLERATAPHREEAATKGLELHLDTRQVPAALSTDRMLLERALWHLVHNAVRFTETGEVQVSGRSTEGSLLLEVQDTGPGIEPSRLDELTNPFTKGDMTQGREHGGAGIGLAIAHTTATVLGGRLEIDTSERGTRAVIRIPLAL